MPCDTIRDKAFVDGTNRLSTKAPSAAFVIKDLYPISTIMIHFAFDSLQIEKAVRHGIELLLKQGINHDRLSFYVLVNFNSTIEQDLRRIAILDEYGVNSFVMVYDKAAAPQKIKHLGARWCNKYQTKKSCKFEDYDPRIRRAKGA
ncbi:hypothetical protein Ga0466249_001684 [Sporomusaceae bacterium BoRhaA]|uniref:hypothetical protein n=1 Tax=Pelorhabdus rhamnosifermentans TaxID=2772457 RepID=UPI001C064481|nr:hypothetical protein [Pelorhabdus rhamnosifermentans]MBU2700592.1 hypothetical protein [Pelorhabdus rhamnosifermentans]